MWAKEDASHTCRLVVPTEMGGIFTRNCAPFAWFNADARKKFSRLGSL
jgi:hypothetical protein